MRKFFFSTATPSGIHHFGLLVLRLGFGLWLGLFHGLNALTELLAGNTEFPDPFGMGSATTKWLMGVFAEFVCALLVAAGLFTRLACVPIVAGFFIAVFVQHGADDFWAKNLPSLYMFGFAVILLLGPGRYSIDEQLQGSNGGDSQAE